MRRGVLLGLIAIACWSLAVGSAIGGDVTPMAKGGGKSRQLKAPAPVPQTGQTAVYSSGDDGSWQKGVPWPVPRFTDHRDGTVTDNLTGLIWMQTPYDTEYPYGSNGYQTWENACAICNGLEDPDQGLTDRSVAGDWRLANVKELQSLIDYGTYNPALPEGHPFTLENWAGAFWSSTTYAGDSYPNDAWFVNIPDGMVNHTAKGNGYYVWCVRGGK